MKNLIIFILLIYSGFLTYFVFVKSGWNPFAAPHVVTKEQPPLDPKALKNEAAFAADQLFAVISKEVMPAKYYEDFFQRPMKLSTTRKLSEVYLLRCLGRETRNSYIFVVNRETYVKATVHQKFDKAQASSFDVYFDEETLHREIFQRRFREKMLN